MARPARRFIRRCLAGIDLTGYVPPRVACEWLRGELSMVDDGLDGQMMCKPWSVWLVWCDGCMDSKRVQLLCCVGERQALRIMDWAMRLDGYMMRLYSAGDDDGTHATIDVSDMVEWTPCMNGLRLDRPSVELWERDESDEVHLYRHRISREALRAVLDRL